MDFLANKSDRATFKALNERSDHKLMHDEKRLMYPTPYDQFNDENKKSEIFSILLV